MGLWRGGSLRDGGSTRVRYTFIGVMKVNHDVDAKTTDILLQHRRLKLLFCALWIHKINGQSILAL